MNKFIKYSAIALAGLAVLSSCDITGLDNSKDALDTAKYSDTKVTLASFGPNPVMRGATLRFFGSNLDQIVEVQVPGAEPITAIEVVAGGKVGEIRIQLPAENIEPGYVTLVTKDGKKLKTQSELTYTEPIVFESFSVTEPAYPGDVITLKGDYMNLVDHVIFEGGDMADIEEGASRHEAKVIIPAKAISGKIILSDGAEIENLLYSEKDLTVGKPSITKLDEQKVKPGDVIFFEGKHLEMIEAVKFTKMNELQAIEDFTLNNGRIKIVVPDFATNGIVSATSFAGDEFEICDIVCVMPSSLEVLNTAKAGGKLIISGVNLDLVAKVDLSGAENAPFEVSDGKLNVTVPASATAGTANIFHSNGEFVSVDYSLIEPVITNVSPLELYAGDEPVKVEGTDLDLVTSAQIGGKDVAITEQSETSLTLATDVTSVSGCVSLFTANGNVYQSDQLVTMKYHSKVIVTSRPDAQHIGQEVVLKGSNMDLVESIFIGETKVTKYGLRTPEEIRFLMPWCKVGTYDLKFQLYDGDIEQQAQPIEVLLEQDIKTVWTGNFAIGGWDGGMQALAWGGYDWSTVPAGTELIVHYLINPGDYHQIRAGNGSWSALPTWKTLPGSDGDGNVPVSEDGYLSIKLTAADLAELTNNGGLVLCGAFFIVTKVQLVSEISQEITVYQGPCKMTWGDDGRFGIAMKYFEQCQPGSKLIFYINQNGVWGQIQLNDGGWGNGDMKFEELGNDAYIKPDFVAADVTRVELTLTEALLSHILATPGNYFGINTDTDNGVCGMIIQGSDWTVEQVTILP